MSASALFISGVAPVLATDDATNAKREYVVSEFVQSVGRNNLVGTPYMLSTFVDNNEIDEAYIEDFEKAVSNGIVRGYEDKTLLPKADITRIEALAILERCVPASVFEDLELVEPAFTDVPDWAHDTITNLYSLGIVKGYDEYTLGAEDNITVEQVGLLTDRTDVYNNTTDINDGYFGYVNNKALRNAPVNAEPIIDYRHGSVSILSGGWSRVNDAAMLIEAREDEVLHNLMDGKIDYEDGSVEQRVHDMLLCIADKDNCSEADAAQIKRYVDSILSTQTLEEFINASTELYKETGVNVLFNINAGLTPDDHTVYPSVSLNETGSGAFLAFSKKTNTKKYNDIYKQLLQNGITAALEGYENAEFTDADFDKAIEIQKVAGKDHNYIFDYILIFALRSMFDDEYTEEMFIADKDAIIAEHPDLYDEENGAVDTSEWNELYTSLEGNELILSILKSIGIENPDGVLLPRSETLNEQMATLTEENLNALKINAVLHIAQTINTNISEEEKAAFSLLSSFTIAVMFGASDEELLGQVESDETADSPLDILIDASEGDDDVLNPANIQELTSLTLYDIGLLYCKYYYSDENVERVANLIDKLWDGYVDVISNCEWMSEETKQNALKKIENMIAVVGYPDNYNPPVIVSPENGGTYYSNYINIKKNDMLDTIRTCNEKSYIRETMTCPPDMVNAFYMPIFNTITIPVGGMEWFFDPNASDAANLGSLGMVIGHEIGHAFDANGSKYDENGCINDWWTEEDANKYEQIKNKFIEYYSHFDVVDGVVQDPTITITENMADVSGMQVVMHILKGDKAAQKEALEAYASLWAALKQDSDLTSEPYMNDVHSANQVRVNAVVASLDEFYDVYDINEDSFMYVAPEDRVKLW